MSLDARFSNRERSVHDHISFSQISKERHTALYTACDLQMESTDGVTRWANLCVIPTAKSFRGMASRSTSMSENEQKTAFATRYQTRKGFAVGVALPLTHASRITLQTQECA